MCTCNEKTEIKKLEVDIKSVIMRTQGRRLPAVSTFRGEEVGRVLQNIEIKQ